MDSLVTMDTGADTSVADAFGDSDPFAGVWKPLSGLPAECGSVVAVDPAAAVPPLEWVACPSGKTGCRLLQVDWAAPPGPPFFLLNRPVHVKDGMTYFVQQRWYVGSPDSKRPRAIFAVGTFDGPAQLALRYAPEQSASCGLTAAIGPYGIAAWGVSATDEKSQFIIQSPWSPLGLVATAADLAALGAAGVQRLAVGHDDVFLEAYTPDGVGVFDLASRTFKAATAKAEGVIGVKGGALGVGFAVSAVVFTKADGTSTNLILPEPGRVVTWVSVDRANAENIVWVESTVDSTGVYRDPIIWTSPPANVAADVKRRKVAKLTDMTGGAGGAGQVVNAGMALTLTSPTSATLTRLSDGAGWVISAAEPSQVVSRAVWVDADEVIVGVKDAKSPGSATSIQRLRLETLGPVTVSSGI